MKRIHLHCLFLLLPAFVFAQGTVADYERANGLREKYANRAVNVPERANWIEQTARFWYRKAVKGGNEFVLVDAETQTKRPAFDHEKLAVALSAAAGEKYKALKLPFQAITFVNNERALTFAAAGSHRFHHYVCHSSHDLLQDAPVIKQRRQGRDQNDRGRNGHCENKTLPRTERLA